MSKSDETPVGLIGLGRVGMALAYRLKSASRQVVGYRRGAAEDFRLLGGAVAISVADVAEQCETIILALPDQTASTAVLREITGFSPKTIVNMTSMLPADAVALAALAAGEGHAYLEAPINGMANTIRDGAGFIMVGAEATLYEGQCALFDILAARTLRAGEVGAASAMKSASLLMMMTNTLGVAEAFGYAASHGVEPGVMLECLSGGPAASSALSHRGPLMVARDYHPQLGRLVDFRDLVAAVKATSDAPMLLLGQAIACLDMAVAAGHGNLDLSAVYEVCRR